VARHQLAVRAAAVSAVYERPARSELALAPAALPTCRA
jgi:hypothetical protein